MHAVVGDGRVDLAGFLWADATAWTLAQDDHLHRSGRCMRGRPAGCVRALQVLAQWQLLGLQPNRVPFTAVVWAHMRKGLDDFERLAGPCTSATARAPAQDGHLHRRGLCMSPKGWIAGGPCWSGVVATARTPAQDGHLHSNDLCMREGLDGRIKLRGLTALGGARARLSPVVITYTAA